MIFLLDSYGVFFRFIVGSCGMFVIFLLDFYGVTTCFPWEFHGGPVEFPNDFKGMGFPPDSSRFCMVLCMIFYGGSLWVFIGFP